MSALAELFGARVRKERAKRGWSMRELHAKAGVGINTISRVENGHNIVLAGAAALAGAFGLTVDALLTAPQCAHCDDAPLPGFTCNACNRSTP